MDNSSRRTENQCKDENNYGYLTNLWNCTAVKFFFMLRYHFAKQFLESAVEPLYMLKITKAPKSCQTLDGQEKVIFYRILKIQLEVFRQVVNKWIIELYYNIYESYDINDVTFMEPLTLYR